MKTKPNTKKQEKKGKKLNREIIRIINYLHVFSIAINSNKNLATYLIENKIKSLVIELKLKAKKNCNYVFSLDN